MSSRPSLTRTNQAGPHQLGRTPSSQGRTRRPFGPLPAVY